MNPFFLISILSAAVILLLALEHLFPLRQRTCSTLRRLLVNFAISALAFGASESVLGGQGEDVGTLVLGPA